MELYNVNWVQRNFKEKIGKAGCTFGSQYKLFDFGKNQGSSLIVSMEQDYQNMHSRKKHKFNRVRGAAMSCKLGRGVVIWKAPPVECQSLTPDRNHWTPLMFRQNIIWIHEGFFFSFCVSLERHVNPLLILALTVRAHCQPRFKHVNALNLLLFHSETKINQRMLRLQAASAWSLKEKEWRVKNW